MNSIGALISDLLEDSHRTVDRVGDDSSKGRSHYEPC
jgi:hypothetical protein